MKELRMNKRLAISLAMAAVFIGGTYAAPQKDATYKGDIMDSACAKGGAHNPSMGDAKACTEACVKNGSKYVLYDAATKTTYQLDDQKKPAAFAGAAVEVSGTLDKGINTIHVASIKAAS